MRTDEKSSLDGQAVQVVLGHPLTVFREALVCLLQESGFQVMGQTDTSDGLLDLARSTRFGVAVLDWDLPSASPETVFDLLKTAPEMRVVVLANPQGAFPVAPVLEAGASGCLSVNLPKAEFISSLRMLAAGDLIVSRELAQGWKQQTTTEADGPSIEQLSGREQEVLGLVTKGATNREIAEELTVATSTVKVHLRRILEKLNLRNRQQAAAYAVQEGVAEPMRQPDGELRPPD